MVTQNRKGHRLTRLICIMLNFSPCGLFACKVRDWTKNLALFDAKQLTSAVNEKTAFAAEMQPGV